MPFLYCSPTSNLFTEYHGSSSDIFCEAFLLQPDTAIPERHIEPVNKSAVSFVVVFILRQINLGCTSDNGILRLNRYTQSRQ